MGRKSAAHSAIGGITSNIVCDRVQRRAVENGNRRNALRFSTLLRCRTSMRVISAFIKLTKVALVLYVQQTFFGDSVIFRSVACFPRTAESSDRTARSGCSFVRRAVGGPGFPPGTEGRWLIFRCKEQQ